MAVLGGVSASHSPMITQAPVVTTDGYTCACCEGVHEGLPPAIGIEAPFYWDAGMRGRRGCKLTTDTCVIDDKHFFVRAILRLPVVDAEQDFEWGVWVTQSEANFRFRRRLRNRFQPQRVTLPSVRRRGSASSGRRRSSCRTPDR
jgi:hypothetical protein